MDVGGPTANMYGFECHKKLNNGACENRSCLFPDICTSLEIDHSKQIALLDDIKKVPGVKNVFVTSGIRYDMILADKKYGNRYLKTLIREHISGQMKIAPEHTDPFVLDKMQKPGLDKLLAFRELFNQYTKADGKKQFLSYYFIAAHPGCSLENMKQLKRVCTNSLQYTPEQVQLFTPTPSTRSTMMYCTDIDPLTGDKCFVERSSAERQKQMTILLSTPVFLKKEFSADRHGDSRHGDSRHGDSRHGDSRHGDSRHGDSRRGDSRHGNSRHSDSRHVDSRHGDSRHGDARRGDSRHRNSKRGGKKSGIRNF